ncbi:hypothetical protein BJF79_02590 [Actinomadura sp. CNU-125]|uniref:dihydrofolate reductase family protein n=1 Tax=Actinomadura sp. CNU-125 TaxID=1904961 RepID=UPI00095DAD61|nr:dihydrofolate reductase family protein [Actinomadura sp. CNU-125]OLT19121.1 hypothetical protein BJF79_02590 [Actinomadura sp. CNU-125]
MRKLAAGMSITLDGVVDGEPEWVGPYHSPEFGATIRSLMTAGDTMLLGRNTYEYFAGVFGGQSGPEAEYLTNVPKFVVSRTLKSADWNNSTVIGANLAEEVAELKRQPGTKINVSGSITLVQWLLAEGLLDELHLLLFPVAVGKGRRLFEGLAAKTAFELADTETLPNGVQHITYNLA